MAEYIDKESILDKIGSLPLNWEYGQAVDDIYKMVEAEPTMQIGCCEDCALKDTFDCICSKNGFTPDVMKFCSFFVTEEGQ